MKDRNGTSHADDDQALLLAADAAHTSACRAQVELLRLIAEADQREVWRDAGARDMAHFLSMRYGISQWKARRWIAASHALRLLPRVREALAQGDLGIDKAVELTRFATPETEARLILWARGVSAACVRRKGDLATAPTVEEAGDTDAGRFVRWWYQDEGRRFGFEGELPAAQGAVVARALTRSTERLPVLPGEEGSLSLDARRADALVALASARLAADADPDRATIVVHATAEALATGQSGCEIEGGGVIHAEAARRLACHGRVQVVIEDEHAQPVRLGRVTRQPPEWMVRQLRYRDSECRFPGCGARRFTQAHHIVWWELGGTTDLDNLILICSFHHKLVHEYRWRVVRASDGTVRWFRPDGAGYRAGPVPVPA